MSPMPIDTLAVPADRQDDPLYAPHRAEGRFFNPWAPFPHTLLQLVRFWTWPRRPAARRRRLVPRPELPSLGDEARAAITWVGHCTFVVQEDSEVLLTDPHWGPRSKTRRRKVPPGVALDAVPDRACALLSHGHYDHLDRYTVTRLSRETRWFVPLGHARWFRRLGHRHVVELDWWQRVTQRRWRLTCLPAQHWSQRLSHRRNRALWCSWLVESPTRRYYFAGDSGYFRGFEEIGRRFGPIDVAFLPIGTYEPRWHLAYQHMDPAETYQACLDLRARTMVPMHWGTFQMAWDPMNDAPRALRRAILDRGGDSSCVRQLDIGESWMLPSRGGRTPGGPVV